MEAEQIEAMDVDIEPSGNKNPVTTILNEKIKEIEKGVLKKEPRFILRALSRLFPLRKSMNEENLSELLSMHYLTNADLGRWIHFEPATLLVTEEKQDKSEPLPEVDAFLHLLVLLRLIDSGKLNEALSCSEHLIKKICNQNRRTMDLIGARGYFYYSRVFELSGKSDRIRSFLLSRLRTCTLRSDIVGQATLINCLLRNYLEYNLYDLAEKFVSKVRFPEQANNNEWARFLYYLARIKVTRLEYSEAQRNVLQALRKAPETTAVGFRQAANKLAICIELLLGDIPDKKIFKEFKMRNSLAPYLKLTQAVRDGDLINFGGVLDIYGDKFRSDCTFNLILRLRRNVIKTAIRGIGLSYARISPAQVAKKLGLDNPEEALYIIAKAIRDGVIEASLVPGFMVSLECGDMYRTLVPTDCYRLRIEACLELHNSSVTSMRYPVKKYESKLGPEEQEDLDDDLDVLFI